MGQKKISNLHIVTDIKEPIKKNFASMAMRLTQAVRNITKVAPQLCCRAVTRQVSSRMLCSLSSITTRQQQYQQQSILQQAAALNTQQQRHMGGGPPHADFHSDLDESTLNVFRLYDKV